MHSTNSHLHLHLHLWPAAFAGARFEKESIS